jgi:hypothetical protein
MSAPKKKPSGVRTSLRFDPPSLEEAIYAAQGLTDDVDSQAEIAARLMGFPEADVIPSPNEDDSSQFQSTRDVIQHGKRGGLLCRHRWRSDLITMPLA